MNQRAFVIGGLAALSLSAALIGCGGGSDSTDPDATPTPMGATPTPTPGAPGVRRIVYAYQDPVSKNTDIYTIMSDGTGKKRLTEEFANEFAPDLSPDGSKIVYQSSNTIKIMNVDGTNVKTLSEYNTGHTAPRFSPDGTKIVYTAIPPTGGRASVYIQAAVGGTPILISRDTAAQYGNPDFSPDGNKIVCSRFAVSGLRNGLVIMNNDGSNETTLKSSAASLPRWSPDGSTILYRGTEGAGGEIFTIKADGTADTKIGTGIASAWAPDGSKILFSKGTSTDAMVLYAINPDGTGETLLGATTENGFDASF